LQQLTKYNKYNELYWYNELYLVLCLTAGLFKIEKDPGHAGHCGRGIDRLVQVVKD